MTCKFPSDFPPTHLGGYNLYLTHVSTLADKTACLCLMNGLTIYPTAWESPLTLSHSHPPVNYPTPTASTSQTFLYNSQIRPLLDHDSGGCLVCRFPQRTFFCCCSFILCMVLMAKAWVYLSDCADFFKSRNQTHTDPKKHSDSDWLRDGHLKMASQLEPFPRSSPRENFFLQHNET